MLSELNRVMEGIGAKVPKTPKPTGISKSMFFRAVICCRNLTIATGLGTNKIEAFDLANEEDLADIMCLYQEYFKLSEDDDDDSPVLANEVPINFSLQDVEDGDLGMEEESKLDPDILAHRLGFLKKRLPPQFMDFRHRSSTAWDNPDNFIPDSDSLQTLQLHWHQLCGVHSFARNTFTSDPGDAHCTGMLICDEVGLGKTALTISILAFLSQCVLLQEENLKPPPVIGKLLQLY
jgi:TATA-binding protein-associated factor